LSTEDFVIQKPCEIDSKPYRMYYKDDWRCDCKEHTDEIYVKILNKLFETKNTLFNEYVNWQNKPDDYYSLSTKLECIDMNLIRNAEFHGLLLQRMYNDGNRITLHFTATGWFGDEPTQTTKGNLK